MSEKLKKIWTVVRLTLAVGAIITMPTQFFIDSCLDLNERLNDRSKFLANHENLSQFVTGVLYNFTWPYFLLKKLDEK